MDGVQASRDMRLHDDDELRREGLFSLLRLHFPKKYRFKEKDCPDELNEKRAPTTYHRAKATLENGSPELIQRINYAPLEQAHAYRQTVDRYNAKGLSRGKTIRKLHDNVNKTTDRIKDYLNLLNLPHDIPDRVHRKEISFTKARELTQVTRRKPEGPAGPSGRIVERGEGGRIMSGSRPLDERMEELGEASRMLSILSIRFLFLEDE